MTFQDFVAESREPAALLGARPPRLVAHGRRRAQRRAIAPWPGSRHRGAVRFLITQNVDGLHERAGQQRMVALHGRISEVVCLDCGGCTDRVHDAARADQSPTRVGWRSTARSTARPDGDVELEETGRFVVPGCPGCGGRLKPHVVFFGENVPRERVERCYAALDEADALLVAGSSLTVMSGLRFVRYAAKAGLPVVIVNRGVTRGDDLATVKVEAGLQRVAVGVGLGARDEDVLGGLGDDLRSLA